MAPRLRSRATPARRPRVSLTGSKDASQFWWSFVGHRDAGNLGDLMITSIVWDVRDGEDGFGSIFRGGRTDSAKCSY